MATVLAAADRPLGAIAAADQAGAVLVFTDQILGRLAAADMSGMTIARGGVLSPADAVEDTRTTPPLTAILRPAGIVSAEAFGAHGTVVVPGTGTLRLLVAGIQTGQAFGTARSRRTLKPAGIATVTASLFPSATLHPSPQLVPVSAAAGTPLVQATSRHAFQPAAFED
jgi:hypothetical protein